MKNNVILAMALCFISSGVFAEEPHFAHKLMGVDERKAKGTMKLTLLPQEALVPGKSISVLAKLTSLREQFLITDKDLDTVHATKFHLLVIDPTLTDYQHIHPEPDASTPGLYHFTFTPHRAGGYRAWADVTPVTTHKQEFVRGDLGDPRGGAIDKTETREATVGGYHFALSFDTPPAKGKASMGTVTVTDAKGKPVTSLEPVMGAYAHIVGLYDDFRTVTHTHPMGAEPSTPDARGGPELMFHLEPQRAGFVKLFVQVRIGGKDIYAPFGIKVQ